MTKVLEILGLIFTKVHKSKTLIVGWLTLIAATFELWTNSEFIAQYPQVVAGIAAALGAVQLVLRAVTTLSLDEK